MPKYLSNSSERWEIYELEIGRRICCIILFVGEKEKSEGSKLQAKDAFETILLLNLLLLITTALCMVQNELSAVSIKI